MYDPDWVRAYYDELGPGEWARWDRSPVERVKLETHLHYLRRFLGPDDNVLEVGAGAGRFTQEIAQIADRVIVADISPRQLDLNLQNARRAGYADSVERWVECDMCDLLPHFGDGEFSAVVCYGGPLSYVFDRRDEALAEIRRVTAPGGCILLSVMSLWGSMHSALPAVLRIAPEQNRRVVATGDLSPDSPAGINHFCHLFRAAELRRFLEGAGLTVEVLSASNTVSANWHEQLEEFEPGSEAWRQLRAFELEACCEPGCLDMGTHIIAVCRR
jgi:SAM-dependent methyltransferase